MSELTASGKSKEKIKTKYEENTESMFSEYLKGRYEYMVTNLEKNELMAPDEPIAYKTIRQYTEVWDGEKYVKLGVTYSRTPTNDISTIIEKIIKKKERNKIT
jgi:hypothetical protein